MSRLALGWGAGQGWPPPCVPLGLSPLPSQLGQQPLKTHRHHGPGVRSTRSQCRLVTSRQALTWGPPAPQLEFALWPNAIISFVLWSNF